MKYLKVILVFAFGCVCGFSLVLTQENTDIKLAAPASEAVRSTAASTENSVPTEREIGDLSRTEQSKFSVWAEYQTSKDQIKLVEMLVEQGFPRDLIRSIIDYAVHENLLEKYPEILSPDSISWWKRRIDDPERGRKLLLISQEAERQINDLVATLPKGRESEIEKLNRSKRYGSMSREKSEQVRQIELDYREIQSQFSTDDPLLSNFEQKRMLYEEHLQDLQDILTPKELLEYQARSGVFADIIQDSLQSVDLTEDQFLDISSVYIDLNNTALFSALSPAEESQMYKNVRNSQSELETTLGTDKFVEVLGAIDHSYQQIDQFVNETGLDPSVSLDVWRLKSTYDVSMAAGYSADCSLPSGFNLAEMQKVQVGLLQIMSAEQANLFLSSVGGNLFGYNLDE